jgi:hypothetical protein
MHLYCLPLLKAAELLDELLKRSPVCEIWPVTARNWSTAAGIKLMEEGERESRRLN